MHTLCNIIILKQQLDQSKINGISELNTLYAKQPKFNVLCSGYFLRGTIQPFLTQTKGRFADRNLINWQNVTADVHSNWAHCKALAILEIKARIIAAAMLVLGTNKFSDQPKHNASLVAARSGNDREKEHYLMKISGRIVNQFVLDKHSLNSFLDGILCDQEEDDADGRCPC